MPSGDLWPWDGDLKNNLILSLLFLKIYTVLASLGDSVKNGTTLYG